MLEHPWFQGILQHRWTREQIILGEVQHYLRVRTNPIFFGHIAINAVNEKQYGLMDVVLDNFMEELGGERTHVDIMLQMLDEAGISREDEDQHGGANGVAAQVYKQLTGYYGFSERAAETYYIHAEQDEGHGGRQIDAIRRFATDEDSQERVRRAVKLGVTAFTLEWDGHVQAMTGQREFWAGVRPLNLPQSRSTSRVPGPA
jgi:pyrroloquinoline quinone (PQQ) biosynthesis protein C